MSVDRRTLLKTAAGLVVLPLASCTSSGGSAAQDAGSSGSCAQPSAAQGPSYCLVEPRVIVVPGAARLASGEAVLLNVDDNTAVIVARDDGGLHALSAICTHACCVVSLCGDSACSSLTTTPSECQQTAVTAADPSGDSIFCPCHGSTFRMTDGAALIGPARAPLPSYSLRIEGDDVVVDTGNPVDAATRVA